MEHTQGDPEIEAILAFMRRLGLQNIDLALFCRALTHRSYVNEHPNVLADNERLEFLGDAVLDFLVGSWLYHHFPEKAEGELTRMRAALVGNEQLAEFSVWLEIDAYMRLGKGEVDMGGQKRVVLLGAMFEALVGAIYLAKGIPAVQEFVEPLLLKAIDGILDGSRGQDAKSMLQEWSQAHGYGQPVYRITSSAGPDHDKMFELDVEINGDVYGHGTGNSKRAATKVAAQQALVKLGLM